MKKTIEIPEGYEARIEGNKVILEPKESEDLEKEMDTYFETMEVLEYENIFEETFQRIAKHFVEYQKEQMIKSAVEGYIEGDQRNQEDEPYDVYAVSDSLDTTKFKVGDKVKLIILPSDNK